MKRVSIEETERIGWFRIIESKMEGGAWIMVRSTEAFSYGSAIATLRVWMGRP